MNVKSKRVLLTTGRGIILIFFLLLVVFPLYWILNTSLKTHPEIVNAQVITLYPHTFTWDNYISLFRQLNYGRYLWNSTLVSMTAAVAVVILALLGGYAMARFKFKGKDAVIIFVLITQMVPTLLVIIPLYLWFSKMNLINTYLCMIIYYIVTNVPFCLITMRSFFERIPYTLEEASWIDGCTRMAGLIRIILPSMIPAIVAVFAFAFIGAWNELIGATIFLNTQDMWTIPVGLKSLIGKNDVKWGQLMAGAILGLLPTGIMFLFVQKYIVSGLTAGAVKE
ncbi:MAG: carbohydrate ABC transporter permease [Lachnospiraceae bacterium]|nr:carbohydrate ABC transporter permease [Lachnospiraceae bacterium]